jgi:phosphate transport system permease protein
MILIVKLNKNTTQKMVFGLLTLVSILVILPIILIVLFIVYKGIGALTPSFLLEAPRDGMRAGGIFPAIVGTIYLVIGTIIIALPLGVGAAIYLSEYARQGRLTRIIRLAIVNLAGVPSIVFGLFGLGIFVLLMKLGASLISGALTLALLVLPVIITTSEEAIRNVPQSFREASLALGATKLQTIRKVVLPHAFPGILTGAILSIGRAAGETAPIMFTAAAFYLPRLPHSLMEQVMALPYHLYVIATQIPGISEKTQYGTALVLIIVVMLFYAVAVAIRLKLKNKNN